MHNMLGHNFLHNNTVQDNEYSNNPVMRVFSDFKKSEELGVMPGRGTQL